MKYNIFFNILHKIVFCTYILPICSDFYVVSSYTLLINMNIYYKLYIFIFQSNAGKILSNALIRIADVIKGQTKGE